MRTSNEDEVALPCFTLMHFSLYLLRQRCIGRLFSAAAFGPTAYVTGLVVSRLGGRAVEVVATALCATNP